MFLVDRHPLCGILCRSIIFKKANNYKAFSKKSANTLCLLLIKKEIPLRKSTVIVRERNCSHLVSPRLRLPQQKIPRKKDSEECQ